MPRRGDIVFNWGNSSPPSWVNGRGSSSSCGSGNNHGTIINSFEAVAKACNKEETFSTLWRAEIPIPEVTSLKHIAESWVNEGHRVYGRQTLTGHGGAGILIFNQGDTVTPCPLYTKNTKAKYEYRVHVMAGQILDVQQKRKREGFEGGVVGIRNFANGWVFCRENLVVPDCVKENAIAAVSALGLDFGAVDVGYVERDNKAYVYEVNTAPGIEGTTLERYVAGFKENYLG